MSRRALALSVSAALLAGLSACGKKDDDPPAAAGVPRVVTVKGTDADAAQDLGFPGFATKNTTRVAVSDPVAAAAGVARAVFPAASGPDRAKAVTLVDRRDWRAALAASALMGDPVRAPVLFADEGQELPAATQTALKALNPTGTRAVAGAQVIRVGAVPRPAGYKTSDVPGRDPFQLAGAIDATLAAANGGRASDSVLVVSADQPAYAMPAAGYAAKSGIPILFARKTSLPAETVRAIKTHQTPRIYVLGPSSVISPGVSAQLRKLGTVTRVGGPDPVSNAIAFASFLDGSFGWGVVDPGHGLVFARSDADPATAAAASALSASGSYGPLLLLGDRLDPAVAAYLRTIRPGYRTDPVRAVYNRGWIVGDPDAISDEVQAQVDSLLEVKPERLPAS